jgi:hypothetical protein
VQFQVTEESLEFRQGRLAGQVADKDIHHAPPSGTR